MVINMINKVIKMPKVLHELNGEKTPLFTLIMVYLIGVLAAGVVVFLILPSELPTWKIVLVGILYLDITGGVVANLSTSTNQHYQGKTKLRVAFTMLHILHPLLFTIIFPEAWSYFIFVGVYTLVSVGLVHISSDVEYQQNLASAMVVLGIVISGTFDVPQKIFYSVAPLFMIKLILGFAVQRPNLISTRE